MRFTPDCRLISFDVRSMFTSIPIGKAVDVMYALMVQSGVDLDTTHEFEKLILTCAEHNICKFDGKTLSFQEVFQWVVLCLPSLLKY